MIDYDKIKEELEPDDIIKIIQHFYSRFEL